ncbi:AhpC-TSA-domain-containing protein [Delitschia confertaspora ATCC 74209]|uniref:thioredoxin-dependent peroxiredoxin n=1 Tax=Delitschia confertaspora ATCC 74209 TaxID=1513339 RepID=A0A9P4JDQ6_9PLEO|nr:AhpC-TSA-domain-containing protein [Delitschia confertaspora ATCC 74209]
MVELRKRKTPPPAPERVTKKKPGPKPKAPKSSAAAVKDAVVEKVEAVKEAVIGGSNGEETEKTTPAGPPSVGDTIDLSAFGGEFETNEGQKTTLAKLVEESKAGVVLFTYPKASTPGCTTQACLFRDSYEPLTATGFSIYGLSSDSPKANTTFKTKQKLPYTLLCDTSSTLIKAIGLAKMPKGTQRGVFAIDKSGRVLAAEPGTPAGTVEVIRKLVGEAPEVPKEAEGEKAKEKEDVEMAKTADEVADTAEKIDSNEA